jgi:hypothetical protein
MHSRIYVKAQSALSAYQVFHLRLAIAISQAQLWTPEEIGRRTIGEAVDFFNQSVGIPIDQLPRQGPKSVSTALASLSHIDGFIELYPLLIFHLNSIHGDPSSATLRKAIQSHPECEYLYQCYVSAHRSGRGLDPIVRRRYTDLYSRCALKRIEKALYFSPLLQISIGHWFHLVNSIRTALTIYGNVPRITVFVCSTDSGVSLLEFLSSSGFAPVSIEHHNSILRYDLSDAVALYNSDYYLSAIASHSQNRLQTLYSTSNKPRCRSTMVYFHLRTHAYKNDGHSYHASLRNVDPNSYLGVIRYLREVAHLVPVLVTAEPEIERKLPLQILHVYDRDTELMQWNVLCESCFSVGTASGLSHLFNLGIGHTFRTNSNGLALDEFFTDQHLIACKRFSLKDSMQLCRSITQLTYIICLPWEINNGLASFAALHDLTQEELMKGMLEFMGLLYQSKRPQTLYGIFEKFGLEELKQCIPNRNLASSTVCDIEQALSACGGSHIHATVR